jgi:hypothetical protein
MMARWASLCWRVTKPTTAVEDGMEGKGKREEGAKQRA